MLPWLKNHSTKWHKLLGIKQIGGGIRVSPSCRIIGSYTNIVLHANAEINDYCMLLAKDRIEIGENSTLAYGASVLTSANPNGPRKRAVGKHGATSCPV